MKNAESRAHQALFPIVDELVSAAVATHTAAGGTISCKKGCNYCCHLLIEISWEEGTELALWLNSQRRTFQKDFLQRLRKNVSDARMFFSSRRSKNSKKFASVVRDYVALPDSTYDEYFYYSEPRPCPFLVDGICSAYEVRPTPCRLHLVSTDARYCSQAEPDPPEYEVPEELEEVKKDLGPIINTLERDGRWGHFGIVLWDVLQDCAKRGELSAQFSAMVSATQIE